MSFINFDPLFLETKGKQNLREQICEILLIFLKSGLSDLSQTILLLK